MTFAKANTDTLLGSNEHPSRSTSDTSLTSGADDLFGSDCVLVRFLDDSRSVEFIYDHLTRLGNLRHVDFSFLNYSRSVSASFYDTRDCVAVSTALQKITGISCCIWKRSGAEDRVARVPLVLSCTKALDCEAMSRRVYAAVAQFGDISKIEIEPEVLVVKVTYFDLRAKARLTARLTSIEL